MRVLRDVEGVSIRLTDERLAHIMEHPEMVGMLPAIEETLAHPDQIIQSISDAQARLYHRIYLSTTVGNKYVCVVVKVSADDAFVLTAYLTNTIKKGTVLWPTKQ